LSSGRLRFRHDGFERSPVAGHLPISGFRTGATDLAANDPTPKARQVAHKIRQD